MAVGQAGGCVPSFFSGLEPNAERMAAAHFEALIAAPAGEIRKLTGVGLDRYLSNPPVFIL